MEYLKKFVVSSNWDGAVSGRLNGVYECLHGFKIVDASVFYDVTKQNDERDEWRRKNQPGLCT